MKNLIIAVITAAIFLCACSKESDNLSKESENTYYTLQSKGPIDIISVEHNKLEAVNYQIKENRIILSSSDDFEDFLLILSTHNLDEWEAALPFESYRSAKGLSQGIESSKLNKEVFQFDDLELASALNPDGVIQINPYLIKLDPKQQKVFVLDVNETAEYENLFAARHETSKIKAFTFEDDVWYLLENNLESEQTLESSSAYKFKKCKELKSKNKGVSDYAIKCDCGKTFWQEVSIHVWYNKFGIWETVKAQFANNHYDIIGLNNAYYKDAYIQGGFINYFLDERCGPNVSGYFQLPIGLEKNRIFMIRKAKKPLQRNKSSISMQATFNYIIGPPQGNQTVQTTLNNF